MKSRLFTVLSILSLTLCLATCVLCVRSYWVGDFISYVHDDPVRPGDEVRRGSWVKSIDGTITIGVNGLDWITSLPGWHYCAETPYGENEVGGNSLGFGYEDTDSNFSNHRFRSLSFPHLLGAAIAGFPAGAWFVRLIRIRRRQSVGKCSICGYDLRATPGRCPECGTAPKTVRALP